MGQVVAEGLQEGSQPLPHATLSEAQEVEQQSNSRVVIFRYLNLYHLRVCKIIVISPAIQQEDKGKTLKTTNALMLRLRLFDRLDHSQVAW